MKSDEVEPVCGLYTKLRIRSEKYRPDNAKIDLRLEQLMFFSVHPGMRSAPFVKPMPITSALPTQGGRGWRGGWVRGWRGCFPSQQLPEHESESTGGSGVMSQSE